MRAPVYVVSTPFSWEEGIWLKAEAVRRAVTVQKLLRLLVERERTRLEAEIQKDAKRPEER